MSGDPHITRLAIALAASDQAIKMEKRRDGALSPETTAHLELVQAVRSMLAEVVAHAETAASART